jgi:hypothetical protein
LLHKALQAGLIPDFWNCFIDWLDVSRGVIADDETDSLRNDMRDSLPLGQATKNSGLRAVQAGFI